MTRRLLLGAALAAMATGCSAPPPRAADVHATSLAAARPAAGQPAAGQPPPLDASSAGGSCAPFPNTPFPNNRATTPSDAAPGGAAPGGSGPGCSSAGRRLALMGDQAQLELPAGRWVVMAAAPAHGFVTLGVAGPRDALARFEVAAPKSLSRLRSGSHDDDHKLPIFVSFETGDHELEVPVIIDVTAPVRLLQVVSDARDIGERSAQDLRLGSVAARPLVGLPFAAESRAGYLLQSPSRYVFVRADVAAALRAALKQTRIRFRKGSIAIGDASQWNGARPATDMGRPRHISHEGGRDVDIGLPTSDGSVSLLRRRCDGVLVDQDKLECAPGTVRELDALKLAYLLGLLIDGPTPGGRHISDPDRRPGPIAEVETIFTDQTYIDEIRKALKVLKRKRWIHDEAFGALGEEGLLRPSPWHVDHVHVRFAGESARVPAPLAFEPTPSASESAAAAEEAASAAEEPQPK